MKSEPEILLIRINCPSEDIATELARGVVEKKLAGCANIEGPVQSIYHWGGQIESAQEWVLWLKSPATNWERLEAALIQHHPHDVPAILAIPCENVTAPYAKWLASETLEKT